LTQRGIGNAYVDTPCLRRERVRLIMMRRRGSIIIRQRPLVIFALLQSLFVCRQQIFGLVATSALGINIRGDVSVAQSSSSSCGGSATDDATTDVGARGGGTDSAACSRRRSDNGILDNKETGDTLRLFLRSTPTSPPVFHIQGWRWHCMSLIRDAKRLERLSRHLTILTTKSSDIEGNSNNNNEEETAAAAGLQALLQATDYVINFNMAGLFRIQSGMFVAFLRKHLCDKASLGRAMIGSSYLDYNSNEQLGNDVDVAVVADAFRTVIDSMDTHGRRSQEIGNELILLASKTSTLSSSSSSQHNQQKLLNDIVTLSRELVDQLTYMRQIQEDIIVPAISKVVTSSVQKSFNTKVLLNLGLFESRVHLVGMYDTVWELNTDNSSKNNNIDSSVDGEEERRKFETEIPYVARKMIGRWRESLYRPKAVGLDFGLFSEDNTLSTQ